jgi:DNA-binding GntR family transcriptional regulator
VFVRGRRALIAGARRIQGITHTGERIEWRYSRRTEAPAWVAAHLGAGECVERARTVRQEEVVREASRSWVRLDIATVVPELDQAAPCDPTWQAVYTNRSGNEVHAVSVVADARIATDDDRQALGLDGSTYAVLITRTVYATGDDVIGVGEAVYAPGQPLDLEAS